MGREGLEARGGETDFDYEATGWRVRKSLAIFAETMKHVSPSLREGAGGRAVGRYTVSR